MKRIFCGTLLEADGWRDGVLVALTDDGLITEISAGAARDADTILRGVVIPGMPNVHSHAFQRLLAGRTGPRDNTADSFWSWREAMYGCARGIGPDELQAVAAWVFTSMLKAGYTACGEFHYIHHRPDGAGYGRLGEMSIRLLEAAEASGIGLTLLPVLYCQSGFSGEPLTAAQKRFVNSAESYLRLLEECREVVSGLPLARLGVAPHSLRAVPAQVLNEVLDAWADKDCPIHIHIAEQPAEVNDCKLYLGLRPVEYLLRECEVDRRWCLVHATHVSETELTAAAALGVVAGVCPTTEADLGDGCFASAGWLSAGGHLAIGSDSNVRICPAEELRLLEYNARMRSGQRNVLRAEGQSCGRFLYQHAALAGGRALGQAVGALQPGFRADLVELDVGHELLADREPDAMLDSWVFAGDSNMIRSVWVAGRRVIEKGRHALEDRLRREFRLADRAVARP